MGGPLPNLYPLYSQLPHLPSFFWSELRSRAHSLLSCCRGPWHLYKGMVSRRSAPQNLRPPLPHRYSPFPSHSSEATHLSFLSLGMAQGYGSELKPGSIPSKQRGEHGPSRPVRPSRAPLPPPSLAAAAGASRARRPAWKMADGSGWLVTRSAAGSLGPWVRT